MSRKGSLPGDEGAQVCGDTLRVGGRMLQENCLEPDDNDGLPSTHPVAGGSLGRFSSSGEGPANLCL